MTRIITYKILWTSIEAMFANEKNIPSKVIVFDKIEIAEVFEKYWGSFVSALWKALYAADTENTRKILTIFSNYVKKYILDYLYKKDEK